jgi:hypothetical protein
LAKPDDLSPPEKTVARTLSATLPDIFASVAAANAFPSDTTSMKLADAGFLRFPGCWLAGAADPKQPSSQHFRRNDSISAQVTIGPLQICKDAETLIESVCLCAPRALHEVELSDLIHALADTHRIGGYEIATASTEVLENKVILVIQGYFRSKAMKEALIVFRNTEGYACLSLLAIKPEFQVYFDHLRQALQTIKWN